MGKATETVSSVSTQVRALEIQQGQKSDFHTFFEAKKMQFASTIAKQR